MIERRDGTFEPVESLSDAIKRLQEGIENGEPFVALHVGTQKELEDKKNIHDRIADIEKRVKELEPTRSEILIVGDDPEISRITIEIAKEALRNSTRRLPVKKNEG